LQGLSISGQINYQRRIIAAAAHDWNLPEHYIRSVERLRTLHFTGARVLDAGELA
jgi:hypothetical protein